MKKNPLLPVALIVSPAEETKAFLRQLLRLNFQLVERNQLGEAEETLRNSVVDLVIFDSKNLEEQELFHHLSRFRSLLGKKKTPLLLITCNLKKKFSQQALRAGATDFINAPLNEDEIEQRMAVAFQSFERTKNVEEVAKRATSAPPTGFSSLNHRHFLNDQAIKALTKAKQTEGHVSILVIELDGSSSKEETHPLLLTLLQMTLRKHDILIPQTLGKFLVILPKTSARAAELIAESIRMEVENTISPLSVSIGLITWDPSHSSTGTAAEEFDLLIDGATHAMEEAKKTGNRIITSDPV